MAGEPWRSHIPEEQSDSDLQQERWAAEAGSDVAAYVLIGALSVLAVVLAVVIALGG